MALTEGNPDNTMPKRFVCEPIKPIPGTADTGAMVRGEPGLPRRFTWRGKEYSVGEVIKKWKETSPCRHGSSEQYVRKHWFRFKTSDGAEMKIYFERQARSAREHKRRWWLHTIVGPG